MRTPKPKGRNRRRLLAVALFGFATTLPLAADTPQESQDALPGLGVQPVEYFYTGKPYDTDSESYIFKYRSYDPELNRWTTVDPSGFPDGANNHLYGRSPLSGVDPNGLAWGLIDYLKHFVLGGGQAVSLSHIGYLDGVQALARAPGGGIYNFGDQIAGKADDLIKPYNGEFHESFIKSYNFGSVSLSLGNGTLAGYYIGNMTSTPNLSPEPGGTYDYNGVASIAYSDMFTDPYDIIQLLYGSSTSEDVPPFLLAAANGIWIPGMPGFYIQGTPYAIIDSWTEYYFGNGNYE